MKKELVAEFIGSMFLVMAAISPMILFVSVLQSPIGVAVLADAIAVAFVLFALIEMFKNISGAHFNPVVTAIIFLENKIGFAKTAAYITVQIAGGLAGAFLCNLMFHNEVKVLFFVSEISRGGYVFFGEIIGTFILVLAILILAKQKSERLPLVVALLVGGQILATSSTMFANPQVTIARIFTSSAAGICPTDAAVFIAAQFVGGVLAYAVYKIMHGE